MDLKILIVIYFDCLNYFCVQVEIFLSYSRKSSVFTKLACFSNFYF